MNVPDGFAVVTPYIFAVDADRYASFLVVAFGGREIGRSLASDGRIANCQIAIGPATIMLSEASEQFPASAAAFYLYVENADQAMARAQQAGATRIMDVSDMPYGDRQGGVQDSAGNIWWISQRLVSDPYF